MRTAEFVKVCIPASVDGYVKVRDDTGECNDTDLPDNTLSNSEKVIYKLLSSLAVWNLLLCIFDMPPISHKSSGNT